jgi:hypothetical protein
LANRSLSLVYSQFIEHLGRCVYGGIWAEMLEDRKFYHPITANYRPYRSLENTAYPVVGASPWKIMGDTQGVTMTTHQPFVGKHSPHLRSGSGIRQLDLGVARRESLTPATFGSALIPPPHPPQPSPWPGGPARTPAIARPSAT